MKIANITPGILPVPPNGWGAVEKIIWEQHLSLQKLGHDSTVSYLDDVSKDTDIVHIHVANLANLAHERGIPYYFTMHDHHTVLYGKDSPVYQENLTAIKNAVKAFVPAKYLVDYFEGIPEYISHGVNSSYFNPGAIKIGNSIKYITKNVTEHMLLCVANNGYAIDNTADRKGFSFAINAAKKLGLPITVAGPSNNKKYFEKNTFDYDKLNIVYDLTEKQLLELYRAHSIFVNASELEAGHPNLTILEALSCGLPVISTFESSDAPRGVKVVERDEQQITVAVQDIIGNYDYYSYLARKQAEELDWEMITKQMLNAYTIRTSSEHKPTNDLAKELIFHYNNTPIINKPKPTPNIQRPLIINYNNNDGMFVHIESGPDTTYKVTFIDKAHNREVYSTMLGIGGWAQTSTKYYVDWKLVVEDTNSSAKYEYDLDLSNKNVYLSLESKSIGDTLAWVPYVEEFRKKHNCTVFCSTFWNSWFETQYPDIKFVNPDDKVSDVFATYRVGVYYTDNQIDFNLHPTDPFPEPLQKYCTDILGLDYKEIKPKIEQPVVKKEKQVAIAIHSTAQTKYWNNPTGWQEVVDWLKGCGYSVRIVSNEEDGYMGNKHPIGVLHTPGATMETTISEIKKSEFFIGIGSGLTWLSWALNVPTVLISGFSEPHTEIQDCIRITTPTRVCSGCWNRYKFDKGDWNWCPDFKDTFRQFECTKTITGAMVIDVLKKNFSFLNDQTPKVKPRIQIKHLLTRPTDRREVVSINSIRQLQEYGFTHELIVNKVYDEPAPKEFCRRPNDISTTPGQFTDNVGLGNLTGRHYGCYLAHRNAIASIDDTNYDYTLIFEADAYISVDIEEFVDVVYKACDIIETDGVYQVSFANNHSNENYPVNDTFKRTAHYQDLAHCYLIANKHKQWWLDRIQDSEWDVADLWLNHVFCHHPQKRYTTNKVYSKQAEGLSLIDNIVKSI